jgi:hypothetical protein
MCQHEKVSRCLCKCGPPLFRPGENSTVADRSVSSLSGHPIWAGVVIGRGIDIDGLLIVSLRSIKPYDRQSFRHSTCLGCLQGLVLKQPSKSWWELFSTVINRCRRISNDRREEVRRDYASCITSRTIDWPKRATGRPLIIDRISWSLSGINFRVMRCVRTKLQGDYSESPFRHLHLLRK